MITVKTLYLVIVDGAVKMLFPAGNEHCLKALQEFEAIDASAVKKYAMVVRLSFIRNKFYVLRHKWKTAVVNNIELVFKDGCPTIYADLIEGKKRSRMIIPTAI